MLGLLGLVTGSHEGLSSSINVNYLLIFIFSVVMVAFFSSSEAALISVNKIRIKNLIKKGVKKAKIVQNIISRHDKMFATILTVENSFIILASTIGTIIILGFIKGPTAIIITTVIVELIIVIFGEITPKTIAAVKAERYSLLVAKPMKFIIDILSPVIAIMAFIPNLIFNLVRKDSHRKPFPTEDELRMMITLSREQGFLLKEEEMLLNNIFEFADTKVREIMVPRTQMVSLDIDSRIEDLMEKFSQNRYSRYPIYRDSLDHIVGFIDIRDILMSITSREQIHSIKKYITPPVFVPDSKKIGELLHEMQKGKFRMAIVLDEYGGTAGLVTSTDILEVIVGRFEEELDIYAKSQPVDEKNVVVSAAIKLSELENIVGIEIEEEDFQTVGGLIYFFLERVPKEGDQIKYKDLKFTVTEVDGYKINKVMITRP